MLLNKLKAGDFDIRLVIESNVTTTDSESNEEIDGWTTLSTVSAKRLPLGGTLKYEANQQVNTNNENYVIRYSSEVNTIDASMRVYESGTTDYYYINNVEIFKRERYIQITAERKDN